MRKAIAVLLLLGAPAMAQDLETMNLANALGTVLASEQPCGLAFDQDAIREFVAERVPADSLDFATQLSGFTTAARYAIDAQSGSQRTAHCAAVALTAGTYGFLK